MDYRTRPNDMVHTSDIAKTKWSTEATINADKKIQASGNSKNTRINNILISDEGKWKSKSLAIFCAQSCLTLCDPMDCSPSGSSVHGVLQARILELVAVSSSSGFSQPRGWTYISYIGRQIITELLGKSIHKTYTCIKLENIIQSCLLCPQGQAQTGNLGKRNHYSLPPSKLGPKGRGKKSY